MPTEDQKSPDAPHLTGRQRKALRGLAHGFEPLVHVGAAGVTEAVVRAVDGALRAHELVKVRLHAPATKHDEAEALATATGAALCGLIGHVVILYRPHPETPKIVI
jgi:RNA-binding protein